MSPFRKLSLALAATALLGCSKEQNLEPYVRDVRPVSLERGDTLVVEAARVVPDHDYQVLFDGGWVRPDGTVGSSSYRMPGRGSAGGRVLVPIDSTVEQELRDHVRFTGDVSIEDGEGAPGAHTVIALPRRFEINFFPRSLRKLAYDLVENHGDGKILDYLGLSLTSHWNAESKQPDGLLVTDVRTELDGSSFVAQYDCGNLSQQPVELDHVPFSNLSIEHLNALPAPKKDAVCKGSKDGMVALDEARAGGLDAATFRQLSHGNYYIKGADIAHVHRKAGSAATAGLRIGDVILRTCEAPDDKTGCAGGVAIHEVRRLADLAEGWRGADGGSLVVEAQRGGAVIHAVVGTLNAPASLPVGFLLAGVLVAAGLCILLPIGPGAGMIVVWERKVAGRMQSRFGPNRVGPNGWLQWLADGVKLIVKEDIIPTDADPVLFRLSPYLVFVGLFSTFVVLPFSQSLIIADLDIGLLYLTSVTSLVVVGIIMGGWSSNSKWSLLGGMRSAAQIISYELPAGVALLSVVVIAGTLSPQTLVHNQGGAPWHWFVFDNPMTFMCFFIWFISALAEGNRTPFDLPEAESELVSGYNTEYSGFRFSIFFLTEWTNLFVIGAIATTVFFGGWQIPHVAADRIETSVILQLVSFAIFFAKALFFVFVTIWIRWTLPRFRVDQMMNMCWKYFIPLSFISLVLVAGYEWVTPTGVREIVRYGMFAVFGVLLAGFFLSRVAYNYRTTKKTLHLNG